MAIYTGVGGSAKSVSKIYTGIDGVARPVHKGYIGVDGFFFLLLFTFLKSKFVFCSAFIRRTLL